MEISRRRLADYVKTLYQKACRTCSTIISLHLTNQIIDLWHCRWRWRCPRQILNSLLLPVDTVRRKHVGRRVETQTLATTNICSLSALNCILDLVSQPCKFNRLVLSDLRQWKQNSRSRLTDSNIATPSAPMFPLGVTPRPPIKPAHKSLERKTLGFSHTPSTKAVYLFWGDILSCTGKRRLFTHKILGRAVCKWTSKVITRFRSVRFDVSFKISRQVFIQREAKVKPNATCTRNLSRPLSKSQFWLVHRSVCSCCDWSEQLLCYWLFDSHLQTVLNRKFFFIL